MVYSEHDGSPVKCSLVIHSTCPNILVPLAVCLCLSEKRIRMKYEERVTDSVLLSEGNPASVSQCLVVSGNSCESLLRVCHRVYVEQLMFGLCVCMCVCY